MNISNHIEKVVFYFPWKEVSGGPYYLTRLADELAKDDNYEVYYTDYENGLSDDLITNDSVKKITVSEENFSIGIKDPVTIVTPIYWAHWLPEMHSESKVLFLNWHVCCLPVLKNSWRIAQKDLEIFLRMVRDRHSIFFCDYSHWLGQNTKDIIFDKTYVPIPLPEKKYRAQSELIKKDEIKLGVLGRLCADKIHSVTNLLDNLSKVNTSLKKNVIIIGDGPQKDLIKLDQYKDINIVFKGTVTGDQLDKIISSEIDVLFAMGTSILESAAMGLPSVVIPHNMNPMSCDKFVYLQDSREYCLGWLDTQIDDLELKVFGLQQIIDAIYVNEKKKILGEEAYSYYVKNHTVGSVVSPLKQALEKTEFKYGSFKHISNCFFMAVRELKKFGLSLVRIDRNQRGITRLRIFDFFTVAMTKATNIPGVKVLYFFKIPLLKVIGTYKRFKIRPNFPKLTYRPEEIAFDVEHRFDHKIQYLQNKIESIDKLEDKLESKIDDVEAHVEKLNRFVEQTWNENIVQLNTCDKLVPEESFQHFTRDIKEDYLRLIRGLDDQSIQVIVRILSRIQKYRKELTSFFWFTEFERLELKKIHDLHASSIVKLSDRCFAYGRYLLPRKIISTTVFYYDHFVKELENLTSLKNKEIIDVGGFIGDSAIVLSEYTDKKVHLFEPISNLFELCEETVELNQLKNITLNKLALGSKKEKSQINLAGDMSTICSTSNFNSENCKQESIDVITLDEYVEENDLEVGLIKVDVEGFEQEFLKGAERTIRNQKPALLLSIYHNADDFFNIKPIIENWNLGYKFKVAKPSDKTILIDTTLICEVRN